MAEPSKTEIEAANRLSHALSRVHTEHGPRSAAPVLYHYTTSSGVLGIVSSGYLRATNFSFLNDSSEFRYGIDLVLKHFRAESDKNKEKHDRLTMLIGTLGEVWMGHAAALADTYMVSFTESRDDLSQWRGYGGTADRYCLGFDAKRLTRALDCSFAPVVYDRDEQGRIVEAYVQTTYRILREFENPVSDWLLTVSVKLLCRWLIEEAGFFKDAHFVSEREWRAVQAIDKIGASGIQFDSSSGSLRPYACLLKKKRARLPIVEVVVQSARQDERAKKAVELLLAKHGFSRAPVKESEIPFRTN